TELAQAGWAVVFTPDTPDEVRKALEPLRKHRGGQVPPDRCKVFTYKPGQTREQWLKGYGVSSANVEPTQVPYYVLLVGGPEVIPFEVQYEPCGRAPSWRLRRSRLHRRCPPGRTRR